MYAELKRKQCSKCKETKSEDSFYKASKNRGLRPACKVCTDKQNRLYTKTVEGSSAVKKAKANLFADPSKLSKYKKQQASSARLKKYGIDQTKFNQMLEVQNCKCKICKDPIDEQSAVDHCHTTGEVKGILCNKCNTGLGFFRDSETYLTAAIEYLRKFKK